MASIKKVGSSYKITVSCGYHKGKKILKTKTVKLDSKLTPKQAEKEIQKIAYEFERAIEHGTYLDAGKCTLEEFIQIWLKDYAKKNLAPKTYQMYNEKLTQRIIPALGHLKLQQLQPKHFFDFYENLREEGIRLDKKTGTLSERTILHHHRLISAILTCAVQWQYISSNPLSRVKAPKVEKKESAFFSEEKAQYILELMDKEDIKFKTMIYITIFCGLRLGELAGLEWSDIDFNKSELVIKRSSQYVPGMGIITKPPKNESSFRRLSLSASLLAVIKEYKAWQNEERLKLGDLWNNSNRLFTQWNGTTIFPDTASKWFRTFIQRHNASVMENEKIPDDEKEIYLLPKINFHALRHTNATLLIGQGIDIKTISSRLGHARTSTTSDIYSHQLKRTERESAEKLENILIRKDSNIKKQA